MTPVVAVTLLVGVTIVLAGTAFILASSLVEQRDAPPALVMVTDRRQPSHSCSSAFWVATSGDVQWNELEMAVHGVDRYGVQALGQVSVNEPWEGSGLPDDRTVGYDDRVQVTIGDHGARGTFSVTHAPTGAVVFSREITAPDPGDPPAASLELADGETLRNFTAIDGTARSDCPGLWKVAVTLERRGDGAYYSSRGMSQARNALSATAADWSIPVDESIITPGDYRVRAVPIDRAGLQGAPAVANVTFQPPCDPGFAFEDVDDDGRYSEGVDEAIPDEEILDGSYTVDGSAGLVLPASLGDITNSTGGIHYRAGDGAHLTADAAMLAGAGPLHLEADGLLTVSAPLTAELGNDLRLVGGDVNLDPRPDCEGDDVDLDNVTLGTDDGDIVVEAAGRLRGRDAAMTSLTGRVVARSGEEALLNESKLVSGESDVIVEAGRAGIGHVALNAATLKADLGDVSVIGRGDVDARAASLIAPAGQIVLDASDDDRTLYVDASVVDDLDDVAEARPDGVEIVGTPAIGEVDDG